VRIASIIGISVFALALSGCYFSRTHVHTTDGKSYQIYGDGVLLCEDSQDCHIPKRGTPHTLELEAVKNGNVVGRTSTKREITTSSVFWGFFTYFVTLYVYQAYPDDVYIPLDYSNPVVNEQARYNNNGGFAGGDTWNSSPFQSGGSAWDNGTSAPQAVRQEQQPPPSTPAPSNYEGLQEY
jgi:hypothetical protein